MMSSLNPQKYLDQLEAVEKAAHDELIELLRSNPKGHYIQYDLNNPEEEEAFYYWGSVKTQEGRFELSAIGLNESNRLVALVYDWNSREKPEKWVDLDDWYAHEREPFDRYWILFSPLYRFAVNNLEHAKPGPIIDSQEKWLENTISDYIHWGSMLYPSVIFDQLVHDYPEYPTYIDSEFNPALAKSIIDNCLAKNKGRGCPNDDLPF